MCVQGGQFPFATQHKVKKWLVRAIYATTAPLDSWQVLLKPSPSLSKSHFRMPYCLDLHSDPKNPLEPSIKQPNMSTKITNTSVEQPSSSSEIPDLSTDQSNSTYAGIFRNYFSIGMDAQVAFGFHNFRNHMPWIARGRLANQMIYGGFSCTQGWFCTACSCTKTRGVKNDVRLFVKKRASAEWEFIYIPSNIRAIVILNLQSYAGGRNPWGHPGARTAEKNGYVEAAPDDGLLEIVGLHDGWHAAFVMISALTAMRLCQAAAVRIEMSGDRTAAYMQMDGEPWQQPLAKSMEPPTVLELVHSNPPSIMLQGWRGVHNKKAKKREKKKRDKSKKNKTKITNKIENENL
ncbi:hypothetical protein M758_3G096100 [Ceratodon purpureus]|nr:hypothetical protein M758_3G096100 [Ceratodon purpureus]